MRREGVGTPLMAEVIRGECTGQDLGCLEERLAAPGAQLASLLGPVTLGANLHLSVLVTPVSYSLSAHTAWELVKFPVVDQRSFVVGKDKAQSSI